MKNGTKVNVLNKRLHSNNQLKIYEELPMNITGTVTNYYDKSSKISVLVDGYENKKSRYGCYYFPRRDVVEEETDMRSFKEALWKLYCKAATNSQIVDVLQEVSECNIKAYRQRMLRI